MTTTAFALQGTAPATDVPVAPGMTVGAVRTWLRLEGLAAFSAGIVLYAMQGADWLFLVPLLLLPDISAIGYLASPRVGAFTYNLVHTWAPGFLVLALGLWLASVELQVLAAVLIAHVGMDRAAGYGLKLPTSFQDTHLGRMGRARR
jgi:hypothetical protein